MIQNGLNAENVSVNKTSIESTLIFNLKKLNFNFIGKISDASTFCSLSPKETEEIKNNVQSTESTPIPISDIFKNSKKNSCENFSQNYDIISSMKKNPPKLPGIFYHDYNLQNRKNLINETYGEIYQGTVPNIFFGHLMTRKNRPVKKSCMTQRIKTKLVTIIYYAP